MLAKQAFAFVNGNQSANEKNVSIQRRTFIGGAAAALLLSSGRVMAGQENDDEQLHDPFILLLHGLYRPVPVGQGPANNLGLSTVNLSDGSYVKTHIYPIFGIPGRSDQDRSIGTFYVQFAGKLCAYHLPGGALAMTFADIPTGAPPGFNAFVPFPDGAGGITLREPLNYRYRRRPGYSRIFREDITTWWISCIN